MARFSGVVIVSSSGCNAIILAAAGAGLAAAVPATKSSGHAANALRLNVVVYNARVAFKTGVTDGCIAGLMIWSG